MANIARRRYEVLLLTVPEINADDSAKVEKGFAKLVEDHEGDLISFERWGKYRLAYPVQKFEYGIYYLARFEFTPEVSKAALDAVKQYFEIKHNDKVMRHMFTQLDLDDSLEYERPMSLEETPRRDTRVNGPRPTGATRDRAPRSRTEEVKQEAASKDATSAEAAEQE